MRQTWGEKEWERYMRDLKSKRIDSSLSDLFGTGELAYAKLYIKNKIQQVRQKYQNVDSPEAMQKEIDELQKYLEDLKKHLDVSNLKAIPRDPAKQKEFQKVIVGSPEISIEDYKHLIVGKYIKDPETGMFYDLQTGFPSLGPSGRMMQGAWATKHLRGGYEDSDYEDPWTKYIKPCLYSLIGTITNYIDPIAPPVDISKHGKRIQNVTTSTHETSKSNDPPPFS